MFSWLQSPTTLLDATKSYIMDLYKLIYKYKSVLCALCAIIKPSCDTDRNRNRNYTFVLRILFLGYIIAEIESNIKTQLTTLVVFRACVLPCKSA